MLNYSNKNNISMLIKLKKIFLASINLQYIKCYLYLVCPLFEVREIFKVLKKIDILLDIGSNKGQFSILFNNYFPKSKIYSFEPQKNVLNIQKKILPKKTRFFNLCLGHSNKIMNLNITKKNDSSSILNPKVFSKSIYQVVKKIRVSVKRLDDIFILPYKKIILMKLDVQGYENEVLIGAKKNLQRIDYILIELSSSQVYKNQTLKKDIIRFLKKKNFILLKEINKAVVTKNIYQTDCLFYNKKKK